MDKKEQILQTMLKLIAEQGVHATPMSQIAKESGVATGTIYHHFQSKEQILCELYIEIKKQFGEVLSNSINPDKEYKQQFAEMWKNLYSFYINNPLIFVFAEQISRTPLIPEKLKEEAKAYYLPAILFFDKGIKSKILRNMNVQLMTELIYGNVVTTVQLHISGELKITKKLIEDAIETSWVSVYNNEK